MSNPTLICFGEILWDLLPTGAVAGGAPLNVTFHAKQLGLDAKLISSVGADDLGQGLWQFMQGIGIPTDLVQTDTQHPTGTVNVTLSEGGSPAYEIVSPVAWDNIQLERQAADWVKSADAMVFGSLACRTAQNKNTLLEYLNNANLKVFDVNLRSPFYSQALIDELLEKADVVKMNDEELALIASWHGIAGDEKTQMQGLKNKFGVELFILTRGKEGAACLDASGFWEHKGFKITVQDTIGSGDSFLAAFLSKYLNGENIQNCLAFAAAVGALVATRKGGTPPIQLSEIQTLMLTGAA
jgi:fructokinase